MPVNAQAAPVLYLAPWVSYGGTDKGTIDWFRSLDTRRFRASLITTQPSPNDRIAEVEAHAQEVWSLPDLLPGSEYPQLILDFIHSRNIELVHVMNSRLAFDLLPDLHALARPPAVVVQLHVEEDDHSGYVRYVATRYASLVDAFSVTSAHLRDALMGYGVPADKLHVIPTGVDAQAEFCPADVKPLPGLDRERFQILYAGRLVGQKDPELMVEVADRLRELDDAFEIQVVGDGELGAQVSDQVRARGLEGHVRFHAATAAIARWYRACDAVLMTSRFEGIPFVAYEAMAMALPVVAPALAGNRELMDATCACLIDPRDDAGAYAAALSALMRDPAGRAAMGARGRARVCERSSLASMANEHASLYDGLLARRDRAFSTVAPQWSESRAGPVVDALPERPAPIRFSDRPARGQPLVTIVVPCFNHGRHLPACLASVRAQTYPCLETIVVDDGSTEGETLALLERLEADSSVTVLRLAANGGPSAARNAGIARASGRYVLFLDADNVLIADAVERMVAQLQASGERIGFIYPDLNFFGHRHDSQAASEYNLYALTQGNLCDTGSLFDRGVFEAGIRFSEQIRLGHEDWDLALALAEREVYGEPARAATLLLRKEGFSRSDMVAITPVPFQTALRARHPRLFGEAALGLKSRWSPALSVIALDATEPDTPAGDALVRSLCDQTCQDLELVVASVAEWPELEPEPGEPPRQVPRRIPAGLAATPGETLQAGLELARGRFVLACVGDGSQLLADRALAEKLLRLLSCSPELAAIAFADEGLATRHALPRLFDGTPREPHAVLWRAALGRSVLPARALVQAGAEPASITRALIARGCSVEWRHSPAPEGWSEAGSGGPGVEIRVHRPRTESERADCYLRDSFPVRWRALPTQARRRWDAEPHWTPAQGVSLWRHRVRDGAQRVITDSPQPPPGWERERCLGHSRLSGPPGTAALLRVGASSYRAIPAAQGADDPSAYPLGHVELAPLPMLEPLILGRDRASGEEVLTCGPGDPLADAVEPLATLGYVEPFPLLPRTGQPAWRSYGLLGLVRGVDAAAGRHRYSVGSLPTGALVGELGALHEERQADSLAVWLHEDGVMTTEDYGPKPSRPAAASALRWSLAPLAWRRVGSPRLRTRAAVRRAARGVRGLAAHAPFASPTETGPPSGYLFAEPGYSRMALYSAVHPVIADQLLTTQPLEAADMGYGEPTLLGYLTVTAPVTGTLELDPVPAWWAAKLGLRVRRS